MHSTPGGRSHLWILATLASSLLASASPAAAVAVLGSASSFAVLGASTVTNTGATAVNGDMGVWAGLAMTGTGSVTINGTMHAGDAVAHQAQNDAQAAFTTLGALPSTFDLTGQNLGGLTLTPGVYTFSSSAQLTGALTLDFTGDPTGTFVFEIGSTLTTASASNVNVVGGGPASGIYWDVGSSATLGTDTDFAGNLLAAQSITMNTGSTIICGRAIALNGAITMDTNTVSDNCLNGGDEGTGRSDFGSIGFSGGGVVAPPPPPAPEPGTWALTLLGVGILGGSIRRTRARPTARS